MTTRDSKGRFAYEIPDLGPYEIEMPIDDGVPDARMCGVVDLRQPNPDPEGKGGQGFRVVFRGTFGECDAWIEEHAP